MLTNWKNVMGKSLIYLYAIILCVFNACSSDDISDPADKKISRIESILNNGSESSTEYFSYDNQGRWIKSELKKSYNNYIHTKTLSYSGNTITYDDGWGYDIITFKINNNRITSRGDNSELDNYKYSNGYLVAIGTDYAEFQYSGENLVNVTEYNTYSITYTEYEDKVGFNIFDVDYNDGGVKACFNNSLYQFGCFGKKSKNLIKSIKMNDKTILEYNYELNNDGYVTEVTEIDTSNSTPYYATYKIYYE